MTVKYGTNDDLSAPSGDYHLLFYVLGEIESLTACSEISLLGAWKFHFRVADGFDRVQQWQGWGGAFLLIPAPFSPSLPPSFLLSFLSISLPSLTCKELVTLQTLCWGLLLFFFGPTLRDPVDCSTPGFPVLHHLPELSQTHVHWVDDAIQPSHPLSPSSPALSLPQHQGLFQ